MEAFRDSGIQVAGEVPWGTHLCHFFETPEEILDVLVPFFQAGLEAGELCVWVTCDPVGVPVAHRALAERVPDLQRYLERGRIEILAHEEWYLRDGKFDARGVNDACAERIERAARSGIEGFRASGNTAWVDDETWDEFTAFEEGLERDMADLRMLVLCSYSLAKCSAGRILDVISNHEYALIRQSGSWRLFQCAERKQVKRALRQSEDSYRRIVETASEGVWTIDVEGTVTFVNESMIRMMASDRADLVGRSIFDFVDEGHVASVESLLGSLREDGKARGDVTFLRSDGTRLRATVSAAAVNDVRGRYEGALGMVSDVTERELALELLEMGNTELEGYARTVSHDLRNPLSSISLANSMIEDALAEESGDRLVREVRESTASIERNTERCFMLVKDLLELARAGQEPESVEEVSVSEVVESILEERMDYLRGSGARIRTDGDLGHITADATHVYQVFSNLISNAVKHNDSPVPEVEIRNLARDGDPEHRYMVRDNGSGLPEEDLENVFVPFFRKGKGADTGIGLAIVDKVVRLYGGEVRVFNDGGACFEFVMRDMEPGKRR